jgi:hypothetical protein
MNRFTRALALSVAFTVVGLLEGCACGPQTALEVPATVAGHCVYPNRFTNQDQCREFRGEGWGVDEMTKLCSDKKANFELGACPYSESLGACAKEDKGRVWLSVLPGSNAKDCIDGQRGCELFAGGEWVPGPPCGGASVDDYTSDRFYQPETLTCKAPVNGEAPGKGPQGQVCTWNQMAGCTEEGRHYEDYGSCSTVVTQRPYGASPPYEGRPAEDARLKDPAYAAELDWVTKQVASCACVCCHSSKLAPSGPSGWAIDAPGNWVRTMTDRGVALSAGAFDSTMLGSFPPEDNNHFSRTLGLPSTDEARMRAFFLAELADRGLKEADFANEPPTPSGFVAQRDYQPQPCASNEGIDAEGKLRWVGGRARYIFVLEKGSPNPVTPPNFDKPKGTLWRIDTVPPAVPARTGEVVYGQVPEGMKQTLPLGQGVPRALVPGETVLLYVLADVGLPLSRCLAVVGNL